MNKILKLFIPKPATLADYEQGIIIALLTIGSLTGASGLIQNIFNNQQTTKEISR